MIIVFTKTSVMTTKLVINMVQKYRDLKTSREDVLKTLGEYRKVESREDWITGLDILLEEVTRRMDVDTDVRKEAKELKEDVIEDTTIGNRFSLAVVILYLSHKLEGKDISMAELSDKLGISKVTIKKALNNIKSSITNNRREKLEDVLGD